jgi:hypothetical protein
VNAFVRDAGRRSGRELTAVPRFPTHASLDRTVVAFVNHGRWLWECPICHAAQVCSATDHRAFCIDCFNGGDGWWPIVWPDEPTLRAAVTLLVRRPDKTLRNWHPAVESVQQLQAENVRHGLDPDVPGLPWPGAVAALAVVREFFALPDGAYVRELTEAAEREDGSRPGIALPAGED